MLDHVTDNRSSTAEFVDCHMPKLPRELLKCKWLTQLTCTNNLLTELPLQLCALVYLQRLVVSNNELMEVPRTIGCLNDLSYLDLSNNRLRQLPLQVTPPRDRVGACFFPVPPFPPGKYQNGRTP